MTIGPWVIDLVTVAVAVGAFGLGVAAGLGIAHYQRMQRHRRYRQGL